MTNAALADWLSDLWGEDESRAEVAIARIASASQKEAQAINQKLTEALRSADAERRWWAVRALAALPEIDVTQPLAQALSDSDPAVRQCAALSLQTRPNPEAVPALRRALDDPDALVSRLAGDALISIGAEAVPALLEALQTGNPSVRLAAVRALAAIGDQRSIPALFAALDDESQLITYWANEGLERMGVGMSFFKPDMG